LSFPVSAMALGEALRAALEDSRGDVEPEPRDLWERSVLEALGVASWSEFDRQGGRHVSITLPRRGLLGREEMWIAVARPGGEYEPPLKYDRPLDAESLGSVVIELLEPSVASEASRRPADDIQDDELPTRTLAEDIPIAADWIAAALTDSGYRADYSIDSADEIDRFFAEHSQDGRPTPGGLLDEDLGRRMFALSAYLGEILRRNHSGVWVTDEESRNGEADIAIRLPDGSIVWPGHRTMDRLTEGDAKSIGAYVRALRKA
jgi:hypothetical protein